MIRVMHNNLTPEDLRFLPPNLPEAALINFVERTWAISGNLKPLAGERDQNFRLTTNDGARYVLKIGSPMEDTSLVDYQVQALLRIEAHDDTIPVPRLFPSNSGTCVERLIANDGEAHTVRLLSFLPGVPIREFSPPPLEACYAVGQLQGRVSEALRGFSHEAQTHFMPWDPMNGLVLSPELRTGYLPDDLRPLCDPYLDRLEKYSLPRMRELPAQVIHNDAHTGNVLCNPDNPAEITGIIDFGDLAYRPLLTDIATSVTSFMGHAEDPLAAASAIVKGFNEALAVPHEQLELLFDAVLARAILTVQLLNFRARHTDHHESLVAIDLPDAIHTLRVIMEIEPGTFLGTIAP